MLMTDKRKQELDMDVAYIIDMIVSEVISVFNEYPETTETEIKNKFMTEFEGMIDCILEDRG